MSDQTQDRPSLFGKGRDALIAIAVAEGVAVAVDASFKEVQDAIKAHREANPVTVQTGENSGGIAAATAVSAPPASPPSPAPTPVQKAKDPTYWVTAGNIAHGKDGLRRIAGEPIKLDSDDAAALLKAKIITKDRPEAEGNDE